MKKTSYFLFVFHVLILTGGFAWAQPTEFTLAPTADRLPGYQIRGTARINGQPASSNDWVAIFDPGPAYVCSGRAQVTMSSGFVFTTTVNNPLTMPDGGIDCTNISGDIPPLAFSGCENFTLFIWQHSTGSFFQYNSSGTPVEFDYVNIVNPSNNRVDAFEDGATIWDFTGSPTLVLPVELLYFRGAPKASDILLEWATASELNNDFFEVQRSVDGRDFEVLGKVAGAGTHSGLLTYDFTDRNPRPGVNYYRLRQVDFDGAFEYSPVVSVKAEGKEGGMALYPNPAGEYVEVSLPAEWSEGETELFLRDVSGRVLRQMVFFNVDGPLRMSTEDLPGGYYTLQASNGRELLSERVVIMGDNR